MLWVWFGLDGTGIQRSVDFHWLLGPIFMVTFAFLGNTLFLTILVSMLSTNATAEIQYGRAVLTLDVGSYKILSITERASNPMRYSLISRPLTYLHCSSSRR
ncbi:hypothetical protein WAI453_013294 [Rhynchosporium graminicola]